MSNSLGDVFNKKIHYSTYDIGVKVTWNTAQYPLHHVIYSSIKFEVSATNGLGEDTRKVRTHFGTKLIYPIFSYEKGGIINQRSYYNLPNSAFWVYYMVLYQSQIAM